MKWFSIFEMNKIKLEKDRKLEGEQKYNFLVCETEKDDL